ncbi:leucyl aminopeptidase [Granulicella sp. WH15]|uniref:leucyl aminopeptidase n=1 Tax=Granulicella sp. WH15 TaxID=2602070 RepID=UPI00136680C6|nr:leucyl aminopeptidase [Granulicella sp. WH15]QHN03720.1 leucyl aminopeptidase [Granulicella sp. WH15]
MDTRLVFQDAATLATPMLTVFAVDSSTGKDSDPLPTLLTASSAITSAVSALLATGEFKSGLCETLLVHAPAGLAAQRLLLIGLGKAGSLTVDELRKGAGAAVRFAKPRVIRDLAIVFPEPLTLPAQLSARVLAEGAELAERDYDTYKSEPKDKSVHSVTLIAGANNQAAIEAGFAEGLILANGQNFARSLVNEPGNILPPTTLAARTKAMCDEVGLHCEVFSTAKLEELKMGAFLAVAQGSEQPPALIVMTYTPAAPQVEGAPVIGLVGKGITFDTGGISLKPADNMEKMKYDMAGSAAMIGAMRAIAQLKPNVKVVSVICSAENMPDGKAYRPGDVLTAMSGKTIEVINTDAEGRLVLADGLHYAKTLGCTHLIDAATLTGACVVALGNHFAGLFANDEATWQNFQSATPISGEKFWRLPISPEYREQINSAIADMTNTGGRGGGACTAAALLHEFVGDTPWIHLDIAGVAWNDEQKPWIAKGPTGMAVRSIVEWVRTYSQAN